MFSETFAGCRRKFGWPQFACHSPILFQFGGSLSVIHMKQEKSFIGFIHLFSFSIHVQYIRFISAQNLSHSLSSPSLHFCAGSSLNCMGMKLWVRLSFSSGLSYSEFSC